MINNSRNNSKFSERDMSKKNSEGNVFSNFSEWWYYAKNLDDNQRSELRKTLSSKEQSMLRRSYEKGGWGDVFVRNSLNKIIDEIKEKFGYDIIDIRIKSLKGKSIYIPSSVWDYLSREIKFYDDRHKKYIIGGIKGDICKENKNVVIVLPLNKSE